MDTITLIVNNNKVKLEGPLRCLNILREKFKIRNPNAFWIRGYMPKGWDGYMRYITESGYVVTGLLPQVLNLIKEEGYGFKIQDTRVEELPGIIGKGIGNKTYFPHQVEAMKALLMNEVGGIPFTRGIINAAVNAGKTLMMLGMYKAFKNKKALVVLNNSQLYNQFLQELPEYLGDDLGYIQGKKVKLGNFTVAMAQSLAQNLGRYKSYLANVDMVFIDECHLSTSKTYKSIINQLFNTTIRVGLSGTPLMHKDKTKNQNIKGFFGEVVYEIKSLELMDKGISTPIVIKIVPGNSKFSQGNEYRDEYQRCITENKERTAKSIERAKFNIKRGRLPILIVAQFHDHVENLYKAYVANFGHKYRIEFIHHKIKNREEILQRYKDGKVDILISSMIIKIGQNMPLIRYMQNAGGGDSAINVNQLTGRAVRKDDSKSKVYFEDFWDMGEYLKRHSKHRYTYYKNEGFKVIVLF
jgi:superfamily II DNA or RNA helicase